ncbi:MAG: LysE family translocator [Bacteroidetes bacterium]|nr:LysE family translocator [Bacteroidota bacterium]
MDGLLFLIKGIIVGLVVSIPLGPMGVLCVQRTLNKGKSSGFSSGLGIATADAIFALIAGLGISFIIHFLSEQQLIIKIIGGLVIAFIGLKIFIANPVKQLKKHRRAGKNLFEDFISILFMALSNPFTIFLYIAIFAGLNLHDASSGYFSALLVVAGVFMGASFSWFTISTVVNHFRANIRLRRLMWINRIAGITIILFGVFAICSLFVMPI